MTENIRNILAGRIGEDRLVDPEDVAGRPISIVGDTMQATLLVRPRSTKELSVVMKACNEHQVNVIPLGGATGLAGGLRQTGDEIFLSLESMNKIEDLDPVNRVATVQAGVVLQSLQSAAEERGVMFALDFGGRGSATIGGIISTNAGGEKALRFGMMREQVLGLEVVTAEGEILDLSNRVMKNNTGYDLKHLFIGAEGTLGIVTKVDLRLRGPLSTVNTAFALVPDFPAALTLRDRIEAAFGNDLTAFEIMWPEFYEMTTNNRTGRLPLPREQGLYVLFECEGGTARDPEGFETALAALYEDGCLQDVAIAQSEADRIGMWELRNEVGKVVAQMSPLVPFDVSVPMSQMEDFVQSVGAQIEAKWPNSKLVRFGHLGDNNLHLGVHVGADTPDHKREICDIVYGEVVKRGGSISAEHGIGADKLPWLSLSKSEGALNLMKRLRTAMDPNGILNPGKTV